MPVPFQTHHPDHGLLRWKLATSLDLKKQKAQRNMSGIKRLAWAHFGKMSGNGVAGHALTTHFSFETTTGLPKWAGYILPALTRGIKSLMTAFVPTPDTASLSEWSHSAGAGYLDLPPPPITEMLKVFGTDCLATRCRCGAELSHLLASRGVARLLLGWKSYLALSTSFIFYSAVLKYSIPAYSF